MANFYDSVDEETKKKADEFIELIEENVITKRILPNTSRKYPYDKAYESVKNYVKSEDFKGLIDRAYVKKK